MSDPRITDEVVETARRAREDVIRSIDWAADGSDWPDPMRAALEASVPLLAPRPVVDREALESHLTDALIVADELVAPGYSARIEADADDVARVAADAVLALINGGAS